MNNEISRIVDQIERAFNGKAWHGTPLRVLLNDVDATIAASHPAPGAHSIWELTEHITFWLNVVRRRLAGEVVNDDDDWRPVGETSPERWHDTIAALEGSHKRLLAAVRVLSDADLDHEVPAMGYTRYVMIHGVVQHNLYHAGQIALLYRTALARG